MDTHQEPERQ